MLNFETALLLLESGNAAEATRYLMRCTAIRPELPGVWKELGKAMAINREYAKAVAALKKYQETAGADAADESVVGLIEEYESKIHTARGNL